MKDIKSFNRLLFTDNLFDVSLDIPKDARDLKLDNHIESSSLYE